MLLIKGQLKSLKTPKKPHIIQTKKKEATLAVDVQTIKKLSKVLREEDLNEIEYVYQDVKIRLKRKEDLFSAAPSLSVPAPSAVLEKPDAQDPAPIKGEMVNSPMVGTAYLTPKPGADPFVKVGEHVKEGQTLLIIEAMKVMNPLKSPLSGKVEEIYIQSGSPIEYGEPLIRIS